MDNDKIEKIKEMLLKVLEFDDQISEIKENRKTMIKGYVDKFGFDMKIVDFAIKAVKKNINLADVKKLTEAIENIINAAEKA